MQEQASASPWADRLCRLLGSSLEIESTIGIGTRGIVRVPERASRVDRPSPSPADVEAESPALVLQAA